MIQRLILSFLALVACLALSCSEVRQPALSATANTTELGPGKTAQITVTKQFPGGGPIETVTNEVRYAVIPHDVIVVSETGLVTPASDVGTAEVHISDLHDSATTTIRFTVSAAKIISMRIDPTPVVVLQPAASRRFGAIATLSDGTESNVTTSVLWQSSNEAAATVGRTQGDIGNVVGVASGETTITATDAASNVQARTVVVVQGNPPTLAAIQLTPNPAVVGVGAVLPLTAIGVYSNGETEDLTRTATWSTTDGQKATVDSNGIVTGIALGAVTITAEDASGLIKGSTALSIQ
jgi:hypothetical protein